MKSTNNQHMQPGNAKIKKSSRNYRVWQFVLACGCSCVCSITCYSVLPLSSLFFVVWKFNGPCVQVLWKFGQFTSVAVKWYTKSTWSLFFIELSFVDWSLAYLWFMAYFMLYVYSIIVSCLLVYVKLCIVYKDSCQLKYAIFFIKTVVIISSTSLSNWMSCALDIVEHACASWNLFL